MELQKVDVDKIKLELIAIPLGGSVSSLKFASAKYQSRGGPEGISSSNREKKPIRHRENQLFAERVAVRVQQICGYIQMDQTSGCASTYSECDLYTLVEENFEVCDPGQGKTKFQNKINPERQCLHCNWTQKGSRQVFFNHIFDENKADSKAFALHQRYSQAC